MGIHKFLFIPKMRLITCKNKQSRKCGLNSSLNILSFSLQCVLFDYEIFMKKSSKHGDGRWTQHRCVLPKHRTILFRMRVHKFFKSKAKLTPDRTEKTFWKGAKKDSSNTKEDLHTLCCERLQEEREIFPDFLHKLLIEFDVRSFSRNKFSIEHWIHYWTRSPHSSQLSPAHPTPSSQQISHVALPTPKRN